MTARFLIGDVHERLTELEDGSVDLILTSPPFLALRSYLPDGHPDKAKEIGSEPTPAAYLDVLLQLTAEWGRVLAPHGSIAVELGDTYAGSGGGGGDYQADSLRAGQPIFDGSGRRVRETRRESYIVNEVSPPARRDISDGWPLPKSLACIPQLYQVALAYGINPLTGCESPAGRWRVRTLKPWIRSNPPVGALGDKERPATSYVIVACRATDRWFDLDAVRTRPTQDPATYTGNGYTKGRPEGIDGNESMPGNAGGAPPRDWWHHVDAVLDAELAARRDNGVKDRSDEGPQHTPGGQPTRLTHRTETATGAQGVHLRRALERAGILTTLEALDVSPKGYSGTTLTTRLVPCGPHDGGLRTTSRGCPLHGDRPAQPDKGPGDGHAGDQATRTRHSDAHPEQGQLDGSGTTAPPSEPTTGPHSSGSPPQQCDPAASPRDTPPSRTDLAPSTSSPDTPSAETTDRTARTPAPPESTEPQPDTTSSSTSDACPAGDTPGTTDRSADTSSGSSAEACTCSYNLVVKNPDSTSHYAVWPPELVRLLIDEMCPRRVCTVCGQPSRRITNEAEYVDHSGRPIDPEDGWRNGRGGEVFGMFGGKTPGRRVAQTLGWSDCGHGTWRPGHVLDPFAGSGTTLAVATGMGRTATGIDVDERNADLALERVGMFLEVDYVRAANAS